MNVLTLTFFLISHLVNCKDQVKFERVPKLKRLTRLRIQARNFLTDFNHVSWNSSVWSFFKKAFSKVKLPRGNNKVFPEVLSATYTRLRTPGDRGVATVDRAKMGSSERLTKHAFMSKLSASNPTKKSGDAFSESHRRTLEPFHVPRYPHYYNVPPKSYRTPLRQNSLPDTLDSENRPSALEVLKKLGFAYMKADNSILFHRKFFVVLSQPIIRDLLFKLNDTEFDTVYTKFLHIPQPELHEPEEFELPINRNDRYDSRTRIKILSSGNRDDILRICSYLKRMNKTTEELYFVTNKQNYAAMRNLIKCGVSSIGTSYRRLDPMYAHLGVNFKDKVAYQMTFILLYRATNLRIELGRDLPPKNLQALDPILKEVKRFFVIDKRTTLEY